MRGARKAQKRRRGRGAALWIGVRRDADGGRFPDAVGSDPRAAWSVPFAALDCGRRAAAYHLCHADDLRKTAWALFPHLRSFAFVTGVSIQRSWAQLAAGEHRRL